MTGVPSPGTLIDGKYAVDGPLGEGGMSVVLRARHVARDAPVAIKLIRPEYAEDDEARKRFRQEAVAASRLRTDHCVHIFDVGQLANGTPYLVMELLEGEDLDQILMRERSLEVPRAIHIVLQILRALAVAHDAGVVHRDLKPGNVHLSARDGEPEYVKLLDFGISRVSAVEDVRLTASYVLMGTPQYMAPEQARDARCAVPASDLYSVGALLFEALTSTPPISAEAIAPMLQRLFVDVPPRLDSVDPAFPTGLADAVARALAKQPEERFASAREMALALAPFADERSQRVLASLQVEGPTSRRSREPAARPTLPPVVAVTKRSVITSRFTSLGLVAGALAALIGFLAIRATRVTGLPSLTAGAGETFAKSANVTPPPNDISRGLATASVNTGLEVAPPAAQSAAAVPALPSAKIKGPKPLSSARRSDRATTPFDLGLMR